MRVVFEDLHVVGDLRVIAGVGLCHRTGWGTVRVIDGRYLIVVVEVYGGGVVAMPSRRRRRQGG